MWVLLLFIICQRLVELIVAKKNERWMKSRGGIEIGEKHYKWFIFLHTLFFISIVSEVMIKRDPTQQLNYFLFVLFFIAQVGRVWCIYALGKFWNTKIIVLPGVELIKKGPYKYMKHPNYFIVAIELMVIPSLFGAYITAIIFPLLHFLLLGIRIPIENKVLAKKFIPS